MKKKKHISNSMDVPDVLPSNAHQHKHKRKQTQIKTSRRRKMSLLTDDKKCDGQLDTYRQISKARSKPRCEHI